MHIYDLLPTGRDNAITTRSLLEVTGLPNARALQSQIRAERDAGALILSRKDRGGGYFAPGSSEELREFVNLFEAEARSIFAMLQTARSEMKRLEAREQGQLHLLDLMEGR